MAAAILVAIGVIPHKRAAQNSQSIQQPERSIFMQTLDWIKYGPEFKIDPETAQEVKVSPATREVWNNFLYLKAVPLSYFLFLRKATQISTYVLPLLYMIFIDSIVYTPSRSYFQLKHLVKRKSFDSNKVQAVKKNINDKVQEVKQKFEDKLQEQKQNTKAKAAALQQKYSAINKDPQNLKATAQELKQKFKNKIQAAKQNLKLRSEKILEKSKNLNKIPQQAIAKQHSKLDQNQIAQSQNQLTSEQKLELIKDVKSDWLKVVYKKKGETIQYKKQKKQEIIFQKAQIFNQTLFIMFTFSTLKVASLLIRKLRKY